MHTSAQVAGIVVQVCVRRCRAAGCQAPMASRVHVPHCDVQGAGAAREGIASQVWSKATCVTVMAFRPFWWPSVAIGERQWEVEGRSFGLVCRVSSRCRLGDGNSEFVWMQYVGAGRELAVAPSLALAAARRDGGCCEQRSRVRHDSRLRLCGSCGEHVAVLYPGTQQLACRRACGI